MILGIDPGSRVCGYGLLQVEGGKIVAAGCDEVKTDPKTPLAERLVEIYHRMQGIVAEYRPDQVAVESIFHGKNVRSVFVLGQARGVILLSFAEAGIPIHEYSPREVKKSVVGNGNAAKAQVRYMIGQILNLKREPVSEDASDALAIALCHYHRLKNPVASTAGISWKRR